MSKTNVLLLSGGGSNEHEISLKSAKFICDQFAKIKEVEVFNVEIQKSGERILNHNEKCELRKAGEVATKSGTHQMDIIMSAVHGYPGESGQLVGLFELMGLPFIGPGYEASTNCFNKITNKLWLESAGIPNTPFTYLSNTEKDSLEKAHHFFQTHGGVFVKASNQGSSVGCYKVTNKKELENSIYEAFKYSSYVLIEKLIKAREIEVAVYDYQNKTHASPPGEILTGNNFYDYEQKYSRNSTIETSLSPSLAEDTTNKIQLLAKKAFALFKLKDMSRIDFFLDEDENIFLNEINTMPGHTSISMFPTMLSNEGPSYEEYLRDRLSHYLIKEF